MNRLALWRMGVVGFGSLVVPLDSALNIAFPAITAHFGLALPGIQWIVISYVLTYGSLMLGIGRLGDILGHARVFRAGLVVSAVACLLCALAPSYPVLLACRVLQGVGAALVISCGPALVTAQVPEALRPRALGLYGLMFAAGSVLGPLLGGVLVAAFGWPGVFWFRTPLSLLALLLAWRLPGAPLPARREPFDALGAVLLAAAIGGLLLAVNQARHLEQGLAPALLLLAALAGWGFLARSRRVAHPVLDLSVFRLPGFAALNTAVVLAHMAGFAVLLFVPYHLVGVAGLPTGWGGLVLAVSATGSMAASLAAGWGTGRVPAALLVRLGVGCTGLGLAAIAFWSAATPLPWMLAALLLHGAGLGLLTVAHAEIVTGSLPRAQRGVAGSLAMMTRTLGVVMAASLLTLVFEQVPGGFQAGFAASLGVAAALCALALVLLARR
ncbi:MFS transporter [Roseococcus suduntuyensis]|uniref:MFS family permease n=1 Tax=Roseococcus suduntuyensis TaxID=455361 RepID=A0A840ABB0_9PROT|nr:MFS transporter [Roseococcus suduntuyensis]MBB3897554.1 MFS family permease [Roseococcus suduntuyensis]